MSDQQPVRRRALGRAWFGLQKPQITERLSPPHTAHQRPAARRQLVGASRRFMARGLLTLGVIASSGGIIALQPMVTQAAVIPPAPATTIIHQPPVPAVPGA